MSATETRQDNVKRLIAVMRSPRYWRDRDPELLRLVELGFRKFYRQQAGACATAALPAPPDELRMSA